MSENIRTFGRIPEETKRKKIDIIREFNALARHANRGEEDNAEIQRQNDLLREKAQQGDRETKRLMNDYADACQLLGKANVLLHKKLCNSECE